MVALGLDSLTRPSDTLLREASAREITQNIQIYNSDLEREMLCKMKYGLGWNVNGPTRPIGHPPQIRD